MLHYNCKENTNLKKYFYNRECVDFYDGYHNNYYISNENQKIPYGVIEKCYYTCETCFGKPSSTTHNCKTCNSGFYFFQKNCKTACPYYLAYNDETRKCVNCKETNQYNYNQRCINSIPNGVAMVDINYYLISDCHSPCLNCQKLNNGNELCYTCRPGFFYKFSFDPNEQPQCVTSCGNYLVQDTLMNACINCKVNNSHSVNKYFYNGKCVNLNDDEYSNFYESIENNKNPYGVIEKCYYLCRTCTGKAVTTSSPKEMKCTSCIEGYYLELSPSTNCTLDCGIKLGIDDSNNLDMRCVNCKNILTSDGREQYKLINRNQAAQDNHCIDNIIPGYYVSDNEYNVLEACDDSCATCENSSNYCIQCAEGYVVHPYDNHKCVIKCTTKYWYVDDNNNYQCSDNCENIQNSRREKIGGNQCVQNCTANECIFCKTNLAFYILNNNCVFQCPNGYSSNSNNICIKDIIDEKGCSITIDNARHSTYIANLALYSGEWIEKYIYSYNTKLEKNVNIYIASNMTFQLFKDDNCQYESSFANEISYINLTECKNSLMKKNKLKSNEILFIKYDINSTSIINQIYYNAYNAITGELLNISICHSKEISYSFDINNNVSKKAQYYKDNFGIDIFNSSDPFFNDICYKFTDENKNDVILAHRREYIFENTSLCEKGCEYNGINFTSARLNCICPENFPSLNEIEILSDTVGTGNWTNELKEGNIECLKCFNLIFSLENLKKNAGLISMSLLLILQVPSVIYGSFIIGFKSIFSFLNKFILKVFNPPKKSKKDNFNQDNDSYNNEYYRKNNKIYENDFSENTSYTNHDPTTISHLKRLKPKAKINQIISENNFIHDKKLNIPNNTKSESDIIFNELTDSIIKKGKKNIKRNKKLPILNSKTIHLKSNNFTETKSYINSTQLLHRNEYIKSEDEEVDSFNQEEIDYLKLSDAIEYDLRSFSKFWLRVIKKKVLFIKTFSNISIFEPFSIKICFLFFSLSLYFIMSCLFFKDKYIGEIYLSEKKANFSFIFKHSIGRCILVGFICSIICFCFDYILVFKKDIVLLMRYEKNKDLFLFKMKKIMKCYKYRLFFFFFIDFISMIFFGYYVGSFCAVYSNSQYALIILIILSLIFGIIIQIIFSLIIGIFRYLGLKLRINFYYKLSQILL